MKKLTCISLIVPVLTIGILFGNGSFAEETAGESQIAREEIQQWVKDLGSLTFATRIKAETNLRKAGRLVIPTLREASKSGDPQIRHSAIRILEHLMLDPNNIPTRFRSLVEGERKDYINADKEWRETEDAVKMGSSNTGGRAGTSGHFAQSFIPECDEIAAVEVCTYPLSSAHGWLRLDLCKDDGTGKPTKAVLARSWVYAPKGHNFPHGNYILHDFGGVPVEKNEKYWMVSVTYKDPDCSHYLMNYGLSFQVDDYPKGMLWRVSYQSPRGDEDVKFRILSKAEPHPRYRPATEADKKSLPALGDRHALWENLVRK